MKKQILFFLTALLVLSVLVSCASAPDAAEPEAELSAADGAFTDIADHPMEYEILEGLERGLYRVPSDGLFRPDEPATRGEFLVALWNLSERPGASDGETEIQNAVNWAVDAGYPDSASRSPDEPITRQEAMELLFAHNGGVSGVETMLTGIYDSGFLDSGRIPAGAKPAMYWGFYNVLIREPELDIIDPSGTVSRGDMAEIMIRYMDTFRSGSPEN
ncbi:MAG: S-layer homology domain-containing protein [Oscillibacter sp.]|nr:S-layer homology domain-containing protein [Oscillibacter sp.]